MTAAKVMDIISRLPGCAGQAADAVSAYAQVEMEDAPKLLKNPKSDCSEIVDRYTCRTPHFHIYSHHTDHTAQTTCVHGSRLSCVPKKRSVIHASWFALCLTVHWALPHRISLTYLSCVAVVFFSQPRPVVHVSNYPRQDGTSTGFRSSTGHEPNGIELNRILVKPQNQRIDDQDDIEEIGFKTVVLQPIIDTLSSRFGREHCDAARLGPRRRAITWDAGFTTLYTGTRWRTNASFSLWTRKLDGPVFSRSWSVRETWCGVEKQRTQAYHSRRESLMTSSSRDFEVSGKLECFRATENRVRTRFQKETAVTNW